MGRYSGQMYSVAQLVRIKTFSDEQLLRIGNEADPKGQLLLFIRIVSECDDRYCGGHHSHYSLQIIPRFPACCSMTTCHCRAPSRYPYQLVDTHTQPLSSSRYSHVNRVGGKRSSFLPTFVFRPLTPPYVRFRIRRFLILRAI